MLSPALADQWTGPNASHPMTSVASTNSFSSLKAEHISKRLRVSMTNKASKAELVFSVDAPGHWPARDWQSIAMRATPNGFDATVPVEDLDIPIVYFVALPNQASPMRIVEPRKLGMEEPTRMFWAFVDGFEDTTNGWRGIDVPLKRSAESHTGKAALSISVEKRSSTVATTRIRGWQLQSHRALGIRFWALKTKGTGKVRASLVANASTEKQVIATFPIETDLGQTWQKVDLLFASLPPFPLASLDLVTFEFIGAGEYLLDDLELLGPWPSE